MAKIVFADQELDIPDGVVAQMKARVASFPQYHNSVAEWIADWVKNTLVTMAQQQHNVDAEELGKKSRRQIEAMFDK